MATACVRCGADLASPGGWRPAAVRPDSRARIPLGGRVIGAFVFAPFFGVSLLAMAMKTADLGTVALFFAYPIAIVFGIPAFFLFRRLEWLRWWQVSAGGAACAFPFATLFVGSNSLLPLALLGIGAVIGFVFWAIAIPGNSALTPGGTDAPQAQQDQQP